MATTETWVKKASPTLLLPVTHGLERMMIHFIATLFPMSFDVGACLWLMRRFGATRYIGATNAKLIFWPTGRTPDGRSAADWERQGVLPLNCGGGKLDHHPHPTKPGQCAFTLLLQELGWAGNHRFSKLVPYTVWDDTRGFARSGSEFAWLLPGKEETPFALARIFKDLQHEVELTGDAKEDDERRRKCAQQALAWLYEALDCHFAKQDRFYTQGRQAYAGANKVQVRDQAGRTWQFVVAVTNHNEFASYARAVRNFRPHLVMQSRLLTPGKAALPDGRERPRHIQIFGASGTALDLTPLVRLLRLEELRLRGLSLTCPITELDMAGAHPLVPQWFYMPTKTQDGASMILNGSPRHIGVEPTRMRIDQATMIVRKFFASLS